MIKLTYTDQMRKNDNFFEKEGYDTEVMLELFEQILSEAREKGFTCPVDIYEEQCIAVAEVFKDEEEKELVYSDLQINENMFGICELFIEHIESILNNKN